MERFSIMHPERLHIFDDEITYMGAHQDWYGKLWQRRAGCGPTAASMAVSYMLQKHLLTGPNDNLCKKEEFLKLMNELWFYVTPGYRGVNSTSIYIRGCNEYAKNHNLNMKIEYLNVLPDKRLRPSKKELSNFIENSIKNDNPVAFLNLHNGDEVNLDRWHWVLLVSFNPDDGRALMYDQGVSTYINVYLWFETSIFGGGFVAIDIDS